MLKTRKRLALLIVLVTAIAPFLAAQESSSEKSPAAGKTAAAPLPMAPVPAPIRTAKKVFIAYAGGQGNFTSAGYSGTFTRTYDQFYAAMKSWGHYELVSSPADADLALEVSFETNLIRIDKGSSHFDSQFRLAFVDVRTHIVLWVITEHIQQAILQSNRDKNFDQAMDDLVTGVSILAGQPRAIAVTRKKEEVREDQRPD